MSKQPQKPQTHPKHYKQLGSDVLVFEVEDKLFKRFYRVFIGNRDGCIKKFRKIYPKLNPEDFFKPQWAGLCANLMASDGSEGEAVFWFNTINYDLIVHECMHATADTLENIGMELTSGTQEAYSYLIEWLFREIKSNIRKRGYCENPNPLW